jgi:protease-4
LSPASTLRYTHSINQESSMKKLVKWGLVVALVLVVSVLSCVGIVRMGSTHVPAHSVLHVRLDGEVRESEESSVWAMLESESAPTLRAVTDSIRRAAKDDRIEGLLLEVQAPELGAARLFEIEAAMAAFRESGKWSLGFLETAGEFAKGDLPYALAACADQVVLAPSGDVNLLGLAAQVPFFKDTLAKLHVPMHVDRRHEYKDAAELFTETAMSPPHREATVALVDDLQAALSEHLAARRGVDAAAVTAWLAHGPYVAADALAAKLVDRLAYYDELEDEIKKKTDNDDALLPLGRYSTTGELHEGDKRVALIVGSGDVIRGEGSPGEEMGATTLCQAFRDARAAEVDGVLFRVDSPGGSYVASDLIRREVEATRAAGIPVVVSMGDVAASGGYFVAMGADRIVAQPTTITGSIGVLVGTAALRDFFGDFLGVRFDGYAATPLAEFYSNLDLPDAERRALIGKMLDRIYDDFVDKAAAGRKLDRAVLEKSARGRVWSGRRAKELGLVDEVGGFEVALGVLKGLLKVPAEEDVDLLVFPEPKSPVAELLELASANARVVAELRSGLRAVARTQGPAGVRLPLGFEVR